MANADTWPREISVLKASTAHLVKTCVTWLQFHVIHSLIFSPPHGNISVGDDLPFMIFVYSFSVRWKACMMMFNSQRVVKEYLSGHGTSYTATYTIFSIAQSSSRTGHYFWLAAFPLPSGPEHAVYRNPVEPDSLLSQPSTGILGVPIHSFLSSLAVPPRSSQFVNRCGGSSLLRNLAIQQCGDQPSTIIVVFAHLLVCMLSNATAFISYAAHLGVNWQQPQSTPAVA
ncbi:hypothetical protein EV421DRAFT_1911762 [Armillaria borealis]|uniref:Uncharacterized protein n=1 Tax=Armillaria borealis TaxID=47425 RepID=A0AA39IYN5_9AGAR|nr:hypothetical protein EV421DRAFT_1911762 [Armillaria borealis]